MRYLKLRRLNQAHRELRAARGTAASITAIALGVGIYDLGRFAGEYRAVFGELPSETLGRSEVRGH